MPGAGGGGGIVADAEERFICQDGECHRFLCIAVQSQILLRLDGHVRKRLPQEPQQRGVPASAAAHHQPRGHPGGESSKTQGNAPGRKGRGSGQNIHQRVVAPGEEPLYIFRAVIFPPRGFGWLPVQIGVVGHPLQQRRDHRSGGGKPAAVVVAQRTVGELHDQGIHDHVAGTGIEGRDRIQRAAGGKQRDVSDAADVLQGHILGLAAVEQKFRVGHQRRAKAACRHIPDPKIADHGAAEFLRQKGWVADLQRAPEGAAQIVRFLGNVIDCLPVTADQIHRFRSRGVQQFPHRPGVKLAQVSPQQAYLPGAAAVAAADAQDGAAGLRLEGQKEKAKLFHLGGQTAACDPRQHGVDAVGGCAAHQSHYQPGRLVPKRCKRMEHVYPPFFHQCIRNTPVVKAEPRPIIQRSVHMEMTVRQMLGQKLIFGFHGTTLSEEFKSLIRAYRIGNVILFRRNVKSADQLRRLCAEIQALIQEVTGYPAFIVIDQEGGLVSRLPDDAVTVPSAMAVSATNDPANARAAAQITIRQLRGLGVNFNMAPVLDVNTNPANPVIGVRSFGDDPERAAAYGEAAVRAYENTGVFCCGKHFPGHGDTAVDSHLGLPRVEKTVEELERAELIPFRRCIEAGLPAIMSSHILFPQIEKDNIPGTMSRTIITDLLKKRLGFRGLVFSDCLEMAAIQNDYGTANGTVAAIKAGVDLAEISSTIGLMWDAARAVNEAAERGEFDMDEIRESVEKILAVKRTMIIQPEPALCNREEDRQTVQAMLRQAITCCEGTVPLADENTFFCGCDTYRASLVGDPDAETRSFPQHMANAFGGAAVITSRDPGADEIGAVAQQAAHYDQIVLGTCNAHLYRGQLALAQALAATGKRLTVVALRDPYDIPLLPDCACKIAAYDYSVPCFSALEAVFRGGAITGTLPVKL